MGVWFWGVGVDACGLMNVWDWWVGGWVSGKWVNTRQKTSTAVDMSPSIRRRTYHGRGGDGEEGEADGGVEGEAGEGDAQGHGGLWF